MLFMLHDFGYENLVYISIFLKLYISIFFL